MEWISAKIDPPEDRSLLLWTELDEHFLGYLCSVTEEYRHDNDDCVEDRIIWWCKIDQPLPEPPKEDSE